MTLHLAFPQMYTVLGPPNFPALVYKRFSNHLRSSIQLFVDKSVVNRMYNDVNSVLKNLRADVYENHRTIIWRLKCSFCLSFRWLRHLRLSQHTGSFQDDLTVETYRVIIFVPFFGTQEKDSWATTIVTIVRVGDDSRLQGDCQWFLL